jgi:hypothetical protein
VWLQGGCQSWYQGASGGATAMWSRSMVSYRRLMSGFEAADHHLRAASPAEAEPVAVA